MIGRQGTSITTILNGTNNAIADITLPTLSVGLEIAVTPRTNRRPESNSSLYINHEVIEQSGALSINDLLSLIPRQKIAAPSLLDFHIPCPQRERKNGVIFTFVAMAPNLNA